MQPRSLQHPVSLTHPFSNPASRRELPMRDPAFRMTGGGGPLNRSSGPPARQSSSDNSVSREYFKHSTAKRINTDTVIVDAIRAEYPNLHLTVVESYSADLLSWAAAGHASLTPTDKEKDQLRHNLYIPPSTRLGGSDGVVGERVLFGKFLLEWQGKDYVVYIANGRDGGAYYPSLQMQYILSASVENTNNLLVSAGVWTNELHEEIWVFDQGYWDKSRELYESIKKASWDDVILSQKQKTAMINDVNNFFDNKDTFDRLNVPWKRGVIFYGPPGNGKTISIKAMMAMLYKRKEAIPTLYVKTLKSFFGPEDSINQIFSLARRTAPCYLVFEDLDSIVSDEVRSFFLNAVDGIQRNDGILMVGSTNHLERLDPGIAKRPSRFDRKFFFDNPNMDERTLYMKYWQGKLEGNSDVEMPDKMCPAIAKITKGFSFAYLQEAMIAALLIIARDSDEASERTCLECMQAHGKPETGGTCDRPNASRPFKGLYDWVWTVRQTDDEDPDLDNYILWREVKRQVRILREELDNERR